MKKKTARFPKSLKSKYVKEILVLILVIAGVLASAFLVRQRQDIRNKAYENTSRVPQLTNARDFYRLDVKYVNKNEDASSRFEKYQTVHPDVVHVPGKWNGYEYWMSVSPFPNLNDRYEDFNLFKSQDGQNWISAKDKPIVPLIDGNKFGYSDGDILLVGNTLYMYFRLNVRGPQVGYDDDSTSIYRTQSTDGVNWTTPAKTSIQGIYPSGKAASPTVLYENGNWTLYYVDTISQLVKRFTSRDGINWAGGQTVLKFPNAWHIDVVKHNGTFLMILNEAITVNKGSLYYFTSADGVNWANRGKILTPSSSGWDMDDMYRAGMLVEDGRFRVWYSAFKNGIGHIGYTEDAGWNMFATQTLAAPAAVTPPACSSWTQVFVNSCNSATAFTGNSANCQTGSKAVTLKLQASNSPTRMKIYNSPSYGQYCDQLNGSEPGWSSEMAYSPTLAWNLTSGAGDKKVCVMFKNDGGWGKACGAGIHYPMIAPTCQSFANVSINACNSITKYNGNDPACRTGTSNVTLNMSVGNNPTTMQFARTNPAVDCRTVTTGWSSPQTYKTSVPYTIGTTAGEYKVCARFSNDAGSVQCGAMIRR